MIVERNISASVSITLAEIFCYAIICSGVFSDRWEFDNMLSDKLRQEQGHNQDMSVDSVLRCPNPPHSSSHLAFGCWLTHYNVEYYTTGWRQSLLSYPRSHAYKYVFSISVRNVLA